MMPGRNDPCPCNSGKKFKKCCIDKHTEVRATQPKKMRLKRGVTQEKANAYHEAGHAVFGSLVGPGVEITTIDPERVKELTGYDRPGYTRYVESNEASDLATCMVLTYCGLTSEAAFATNGMVSGREDDIAVGESYLDKAGLQGDEREHERKRFRLITQGMVEKYKREIQAVTDALMDRKTLTGAEVMAQIQMSME
jgi:hypothetical protein